MKEEAEGVVGDTDADVGVEEVSLVLITLNSALVRGPKSPVAGRMLLAF